MVPAIAYIWILQTKHGYWDKVQHHIDFSDRRRDNYYKQGAAHQHCTVLPRPLAPLRAAAASRGTTVAGRQGAVAAAAAHFLPIFSKFSSNGSGLCSLGKGPSLNVVWACSGLQHSGFKCLYTSENKFIFLRYIWCDFTIFLLDFN